MLQRFPESWQPQAVVTVCLCVSMCSPALHKVLLPRHVDSQTEAAVFISCWLCWLADWWEVPSCLITASLRPGQCVCVTVVCGVCVCMSVCGVGWLSGCIHMFVKGNGCGQTPLFIFHWSELAVNTCILSFPGALWCHLGWSPRQVFGWSLSSCSYYFCKIVCTLWIIWGFRLRSRFFPREDCSKEFHTL